MSTTIGTYLPSLLSSARSAYAAAPKTPSLAQALSDDASTASQNSPSTTVTLSDAAKAYLANTVDTSAADMPLALVAAGARTWLDQQYQTMISLQNAFSDSGSLGSTSSTPLGLSAYL